MPCCEEQARIPGLRQRPRIVFEAEYLVNVVDTDVCRSRALVVVVVHRDSSIADEPVLRTSGSSGVVILVLQR